MKPGTALAVLLAVAAGVGGGILLERQVLSAQDASQAAGTGGGAAAAQTHGAGHSGGAAGASPSAAHAMQGGMMTVGEVDLARNGFDPHAMLTDWDTGTLVQDPDGRTCREFNVVAEDKEIEIAPGIMFPAWTYNQGQRMKGFRPIYRT
jgi:hypothetical protein